MANVQILTISVSALLLFVILEAIRKRRLKEQYALLWLLAGGVLLLFSLWRDLLHRVSAIMGIFYPPSALLLMLTGFVVVILLSFSIVVSELAGKVTRLTQKLALLEGELRELRGSAGPQGGGGGPAPPAAPPARTA
jgi:hypothetical protein